jgi:radical SAM protein with 4Fe4S-binding SPASM domain
MSLVPLSIKEALHRRYKKAECEDHQLLYLFLEITKQCNLSCRHCGSDCGTQNNFKTLTASSWLKILEELHSAFNPKPVIVLTGGEPLLHPEFEAVMEKLHALRFRWGLVSNGYGLDERVVDLMIVQGLNSITISLDGTRDSHNWLRGKSDSYAGAIRAIKKISRSAIPQKDVVTCVNPRNIHELDDIANELIGMGTHAWRLFRIFPAGRATGRNDLLLSIAETRRMLDWITDNKDGLKKKGLDVNLSCEGWVPFAFDAKLRNRPFFCRAGINIASILCDGAITGCSNNSSLFFEGNILKDNLAFLWQNGFKAFRDRTWVMDSDCGRCGHVEKCQGGSIHLWRDNLKSPEFCYMECYTDSKRPR